MVREKKLFVHTQVISVILVQKHARGRTFSGYP